MNIYTLKKFIAKWVRGIPRIVKISNLFLLLLLLQPIISEVNAEKLEILPTLVLTGGYDDNILFTRTEPIGDSYVKAKPGLDASIASEKYDVGLDTYVEAYRYLEEKELDIENYKFAFDGGYNITNRWSIRGNAFYLKDTTLDSELEETGRVGIREYRERYLGSGKIAYQVDEKSELGFDYEYIKTKYESDERVNRDVHSIDFRYERWLNEQIDRLTISPTYNKAFTEDDREIDYYRISLGWVHIFSKTMRMRNILGYGHTITNDEDGQTTNQVGNADLSLTRSTETSSLNLGFRSDIRLDSFGELLEVDRIYLNYRRKMTQRLGIGLYGSYYITRPVDIFDQVDRAYYTVKPSAVYNITENHRVILAYRIENEYNYNINDDPSRNRNVVELLLDFEWPIQK